MTWHFLNDRSENSHCSPEQAAAFLEGTSSDGDASALSKMLPIREMSYSPDNDLTELVLDRYEDVAWLDDSDGGFFFGLAEPGHASLEEAKPAGDTSLENFCRQWMSPWKARYFETRVVWHDGEADPGELDAAKAASDAVIDEIMACYRSVRA